ncbi:tRNA pseudouridine38-40 synthase [Actimicrobium sp. GrIS 1.19]|uniref:tRNA pseudouridine(38-40) synthase TruA n=1 Tax=Actimicrobium sp. GrIS 1.19 TaxID=3071708 RepID=UPI002DFDA455|nr:tRNA pseudouridine38-40 synthase [Actimicrobium sp. GrIS 1.19]
MKRLVLGIQYDGTPWHGWQTQLSGHTVQDRLEFALRKFTQADIKTTCAGRTDTGVHAIEQVVHFDAPVERTASSWVRGLNTHLPPSISVRWAAIAKDCPEQEFHARFSARSRTYHYLLYNHPIRSPLREGKAGWVFRPLDAERMRAAAQCLIGTHDFSAFRSADCQAKSPIKIMHGIDLVRRGDLIVIKLHASAFLQHMVRNIVGSLIYVGTGRQEVGWLGELMAQKNRHLAAPTFSPHGLYLANIDYDPKWELPQAPVDAFAHW